MAGRGFGSVYDSFAGGVLASVTDFVKLEEVVSNVVANLNEVTTAAQYAATFPSLAVPHLGAQCDQASPDGPQNFMTGAVDFDTTTGSILYQQPVVGSLGNGMEIDAGSSSWSAPGSVEPLGTSDFTFFAILEILDTPSSASDRYILSKRDSGGTGIGVALSLRNDGRFVGQFDSGPTNLFSVADTGVAADLVGLFAVAIRRIGNDGSIWYRKSGEANGTSGDIEDVTGHDYGSSGDWVLGDYGSLDNATGLLFRSIWAVNSGYSDADLDSLTEWI